MWLTITRSDYTRFFPIPGKTSGTAQTMLTDLGSSGETSAVPSISSILSPNDPITVIDLGASLTSDERPVYDALIESGLAKLVAFEPDEAALRELSERYPEPNICLPLFVGDGERHTYFATNWGPTGSLFEPNSELLKKFHYLHEITTVLSTHEVRTVRLDDIPELTDADFMKIDTQGSESMIFENGQRLLSTVTVIQTEVNWVEMYKGMPLFSDIDRVLRRLGFVWHTRLGCGYRPFLPFLNPDHFQQAFRQELWGDVVYVRDWMKFDQVPAGKLMKMAVILHDFYGSYDLCHLALKSADMQAGTNHAETYGHWMST